MNPALFVKQQVVDLDRPVRGGDLDLETYEAKFLLWDRAVKEGWLTSSRPEIQNRAVRLLNDETIFSYAHFKNTAGEPFKYAAYQDLIANLHHDFTDDCPNRYLVFKASNQIGKSQLLILKALHIMMTEENRSVVMVSRSLPQSQRLLAEIKHTLNNSVFADSWKEDLGDQKNTTILTFKKETLDNQDRVVKTTVNRILCAPAGEGLLGYPVDYLFLDEIDFYEEAKNFFYRIALPRTLKTNGQIIVFSNPNTEIPRSQSILWDLWNGDLFRRKFTFNFLDAPWNTQEAFDRYERNTPRHIFISTHLGEFGDEAGAFFTHREVRDLLQKEWFNKLPVVEPGSTVWCASDLGKMNDQTVISIGLPAQAENSVDVYHDLAVPYQEAMPLKTPYDAIVDRNIAIREHYTPLGVTVLFAHDATGQKTYTDLARRMGLHSTEVDFSRRESNKTLLYNDFKLMVEKRKIRVVYSAACETQLSNLMFKLTASKKFTKVESKTDSIHDDYCDSLAVLIHVAVKPHTIPVTATVVGHAPLQAEVEERSSEEAIADSIAQTIRANNSWSRTKSPYE